MPFESNSLPSLFFTGAAWSAACADSARRARRNAEPRLTDFMRISCEEFSTTTGNELPGHCSHLLETVAPLCVLAYGQWYALTARWNRTHRTTLKGARSW